MKALAQAGKRIYLQVVPSSKVRFVKTLFERSAQLLSIHASMQRTSTALSAMLPGNPAFDIGAIEAPRIVHFDQTPFLNHKSECVRQLAANFALLVETYNRLGLEQ